jgi:hypothetical protein
VRIRTDLQGLPRTAVARATRTALPSQAPA